ncbi:MAG: Hg(II)-responsive transcriptional regulator [Methylotenera sp.]
MFEHHKNLTIGQLAKAVGVNVETIRFYQRKALLPTPERLYGSIRRYNEADMRRIQFIKRAQVLGFKLDEINGLLNLNGLRACADTRELAVHKLALVDARLTDLTAMRTSLSEMITRCDAGDQQGECPIIRALVQDE